MLSALQFVTWLLFASLAVLIIKILGFILSFVSYGFIGVLILVCIIIIGVGRLFDDN